MSSNVRVRIGFGGTAFLLALLMGWAGWSSAEVAALQAQPDGVIAGTVESSAGAEAGVWVIAETLELETKFVKIVVNVLFMFF